MSGYYTTPQLAPPLPEHNEVPLTREMLAEVLTYLSTLLPPSASLTLVVHGGACMLLHSGLYAINRTIANSPPTSHTDSINTLPTSHRHTTRDVDYIARSLPPQILANLKQMIRGTAVRFGLGEDWMNSAADVALPMGVDERGQSADPICISALTVQNKSLHTVFVSPNTRLTLVSIPPYWAVALKLVRYRKLDIEDIGALLMNGTRLNGTRWSPAILEKWLLGSCAPMGYAMYDMKRMGEWRGKIAHAVGRLGREYVREEVPIQGADVTVGSWGSDAQGGIDEWGVGPPGFVAAGASRSGGWLGPRQEQGQGPARREHSAPEIGVRPGPEWDLNQVPKSHTWSGAGTYSRDWTTTRDRATTSVIDFRDESSAGGLMDSGPESSWMGGPLSWDPEPRSGSMDMGPRREELSWTAEGAAWGGHSASPPRMNTAVMPWKGDLQGHPWAERPPRSSSAAIYASSSYNDDTYVFPSSAQPPAQPSTQPRLMKSKSADLLRSKYVEDSEFSIGGFLKASKIARMALGGKKRLDLGPGRSMDSLEGIYEDEGEHSDWEDEWVHLRSGSLSRKEAAEKRRVGMDTTADEGVNANVGMGRSTWPYRGTPHPHVRVLPAFNSDGDSRQDTVERPSSALHRAGSGLFTSSSLSPHRSSFSSSPPQQHPPFSSSPPSARIPGLHEHPMSSSRRGSTSSSMSSSWLMPMPSQLPVRSW